jgi:hypothetical protein
MKTLFALLIVLGALAARAPLARADGGEAGLVIQHGDGSVDTYCVAFSGDSISGEDLLKKVNIPITQFGGLVCAVGTQEGCFQPSSFETCVCQSYPPTNTYWAFYLQRHGQGWRYSSFGFADPSADLKDGDMQAWRWGKGGASSAPPPPALTFEQVCGHAPRGGAQLQPTTAATLTRLAATVAPAVSTTTLPSPSAQASAEEVGSPTAAASLTAENTTLIRSHGTATAVPQPPAAGSSNDGGSPAALLAFVAVVAVLGSAIAAALIWRRSRGA